MEKLYKVRDEYGSIVEPIKSLIVNRLYEKKKEYQNVTEATDYTEGIAVFHHMSGTTITFSERNIIIYGKKSAVKSTFSSLKKIADGKTRNGKILTLESIV